MKKSEALELILALALEQMDDMKELAKNDPDVTVAYNLSVKDMKQAKPIINKMVREAEAIESPLKIGDKVYAVHKKYADNRIGARIVTAKVVTFKHSGGNPTLVLVPQGKKHEIDEEHYRITRDINEAKEWIS